jgi:regulator of sirC expression with transglutaminase-like and TPR domain
MSTFAELVKACEYRLEEAALLIAREVIYEHLNCEEWLKELDRISVLVESFIQPNDTVRDKLRRINHVFFDLEGFHGNMSNYYDPRNSFLNDVLVRKLGIPITLSVVYMAVAQRIGLKAYGVGLPGHFIIGCESEAKPIYIDVFHHGIFLNEEECIEIAMQYLPAGMSFIDAFLAPQPNTMILGRILNNLRQIYLNQEDTHRLLRVIHLQQIVQPDNLEYQRDLGVLYARLDQWSKAARALREYLYHATKADDRDSIRTILNQCIEKLSKLN